MLSKNNPEAVRHFSLNGALRVSGEAAKVFNAP
jgi:hypothetical protein